MSDSDEDKPQDWSLKDQQDAINSSHPFGIRLWKPALYKKNRSIEQTAYEDVHQTYGRSAHHLSFGNVAWSFFFGWWLAVIYGVLGALMFAVDVQYASVLFQLASYMLWPFGRFVERVWQYETSPLLQGHSPYGEDDIITSFAQVDSRPSSPTERLYASVGSFKSWMSHKVNNMKQMGVSDIIFYFVLSFVVVPLHMTVSFICWMTVVGIPMAKLTYQLQNHIWNAPKLIKISPLRQSITPSGEILLCTYTAFGLIYYKYTVDGINVIFINLMAVVVLALMNGFITKWTHAEPVGGHAFVFLSCILGVIPLAYFIGMAVASISSQSSFGFGAVINAMFSSIVEIILYWMAIRQNKGLLVEGAIIGSFLGTLLLLPGLSMVAGGIGKWKEQRFNVKSANVSTVLLIMALIGAFTPTLFYGIYGRYELHCFECADTITPNMTVVDKMLRCTGCQLTLPHNPTSDSVYTSRVRPLMYLCAAILPTAYLVGLWFTLRTHVKQIYNNSNKHDSTMLNFNALNRRSELLNVTVAESVTSPQAADHGHDAPEWSKSKSAIILLGSTVLFALLAELLVDTVDEVIQGSGVSEKFLGLTLFAIVPSFTEFMNAIAFAMYGNVALSLEIGSAYAVQIALIQIPILVAFSGFWNRYNDIPDTIEKSFTLIFPKWDVYCVFFAVFLLSYTYIEGKSNYFKGTILTLSYLVLICSFYFAE